MSELVLGDLHEFAVLQSRLVGDDAGDAHVQRLGDIDPRPPVFEDRRDELVGQQAVGSFMTAGIDAGRKRRALSVGEVLFPVRRTHRRTSLSARGLAPQLRENLVCPNS